jgi:outer membrane protein
MRNNLLNQSSMRNILKVIVLFVALFAGSASAQTYKFGHIDFQQLLQVMPERDVAQKAMQKHATELENQLTTMQNEYQTKVQAYIAQRDSLSEAVRSAKENDLQDLQQRIQNFQSVAQKDLQKKQEEQFQPIVKKARAAVDAVAKEEGLIYVFDVNNLLYHSAQSEDILPLVKKKLGIQ